jgi:hypothetical protein
MTTRAHFRLATAGLALAAAACAESAAQLEPFPCAADGTCGGGLECVPGIGCIQVVTCDPTDPLTCDAPLPKCAAMNLGGGLQPLCIPQTGSVAEDQPCAPPATFGQDTCAPGLVCTTLDTPASQPACRKFCAASTDCEPAQSCVFLLTVTNVSNYGICATSCEVFSDTCDAGETCAVDFSVDQVSWAPHCRAEGPGAPGALCGGADDCGANALCQSPDGGNAVCQALCDASHPCAGNEACSVLQPALGADAGYCP